MRSLCGKAREPHHRDDVRTRTPGWSPPCSLSPGRVPYRRDLRQPLDADWRLVMRELMALRRQARTIGGLLNQVATGWNATGELTPQAGRVLGMVERIVTDVDVVTARARARLR